MQTTFLDLSHAISALIGLVAGYGIRIVVGKRSEESNKAIQKGNVIKGNQAGRDINTKG